ncbi:MAG: DoxX family membrane protein [Acidobacteria bacterium]|nr:DoxX family membrane protein [Acidobacteriota bacterium]
MKARSPLEWLVHPWASLAVRWILGAVMLGAALPKIADPPGFAQSIHAYGLLPLGAVKPVALLLPWLEGFCGLALVAGPGRRGGAAWTLLLMALFTGALGLNLWRGHPVDCGCFGAAQGARPLEARLLDMKLAILRDLGLAVLSVQVLWSARRRPSP